MKQKNLYLTCGIPGSGKSTLIETRYGNNPKVKIVSRDAIRFKLLDEYPGSDYFDFEDEVFDTFIKEINSGLAAADYETVVADATHLNKKARAKVLSRVKNKKDVQVHYIICDTPLEVCLERNSKREGRSRVPDTVIKNMYKSFTYPSNENATWEVYKSV